VGGGVGLRTSLDAVGDEKTLSCHCCESNNSSLIQLLAYLCIILGPQKTEISKGVTADTLAQVLARRSGSDSEVCCCLFDVKEFNSWVGCKN
jgi:hypothetical protein